MIILGIDPDSKAHGVAVYYKEKKILERLANYTLPQLADLIKGIKHNGVEIHMEDVCAVSAAFTGRDKKTGNSAVKMKIAQHIGMCKQAQIEVERFAENYGIKVVKHKISKRWKSTKEVNEFKLATGWTGRSNEDTRSAAYFGYLGL